MRYKQIYVKSCNYSLLKKDSSSTEGVIECCQRLLLKIKRLEPLTLEHLRHSLDELSFI